MSRPKTIYTESEVRRLRNEPCIHCGAMSRIDRQKQNDMAGGIDADVSVLWYCPNKICNGNDGFSIEEQ